jgi:DNA-binding NtrC family response regulator
MHIPPLSERRDDLPELMFELLQRIARRRGGPPFRLTDAARDALVNYSWPGNVRELENVLERATAFCKDQTIDRSDLQLRSVSGAPLAAAKPAEGTGLRLAGMTLADIEKEAIRETLAECGGNKAAAARQLGISEKSIYNKMKRLGLFGG